MPATMGSILVLRKKNSTSVHLRTGRIDRAYAAGNASSSTRIVERTLAVSELSRDGHGPAAKKVWYPSRLSGARTSGGFFAASVSLWNEVSTIQNTGSAKSRPMTQARTPSRAAFLGGL